jgi:hypothetical protein
MANAAICAGVAEPDMISPIAQAVSSADSSSVRSSAAMRLGQLRSPMAGLLDEEGSGRGV